MITVANPVPCRACPLVGCPGLRPHEPHEIPYLERFKIGEVRLNRGEVLIEQDVTRGGLYTLLDGVMMRYRTLEDGRRQIVNFMFPGDLIGLEATFGDAAGHSVEALLAARLCVLDSPRFFDLIAAQPSLAYDITWLAAKEETALEEHLVALGRRSAKERVAYLAMWLIERARATCMASESNRLEVTITQAQIADMLGLSLVHTNRTIKALERQGLVRWRQGFIEVPDLSATAVFAHCEEATDRPRPFL